MDALNHNEDEEYTWSMEMQQLKEKEMDSVMWNHWQANSIPGITYIHIRL